MTPPSVLRFLRALALVCSLAACVPAASAAAPDWVRALARASLPAYPAETRAVVLLKEETVVVRENGDVQTVHRRAVKILRPQGESEGAVVVFFDNDTKLNSLKAWSITSQGQEYEVKEKDAIETALLQDSLYEDTRSKVLRIPAAVPGSIVAYEYEQKDRAAMYQHLWWLDEDLPVVSARYTLQMPPGWEYSTVWRNQAGQAPAQTGPNQWTWQFQSLPAREHEAGMPNWRAVASRMAVNFYPAGQPRGKAQRSWDEVGVWYAGLTAGRAEANPEIRAKVQELTAGKSETLDKVKALAAFVQAGIRYVAVEIGVGGYQPHPASSTFAARYGDCKDKVTLLRAMLSEAGVPSYYVLVHSARGAVSPQFPSMGFDHMIAAVALPQRLPDGFAVYEHPKLGSLTLFDPTDRSTPFGWLPDNEQAGHALLVTPSGGETIQVPVAPPNMNRLLREGRFEVQQDGTLAGSVKELRWGQPATDQRQLWNEAADAAERRKRLESTLSSTVGTVLLESAVAEGLTATDGVFQLSYKLAAPAYAKRTGPLLLIRPRVIGSKATTLNDQKPRKYPLDLGSTGFQTDVYEITIPSGYVVDELPPNVDAVYPFAEYHSKSTVEGKVLRYQREYQVKQVEVPAEQVPDLRKFSSRILADEANSAVLKRQ